MAFRDRNAIVDEKFRAYLLNRRGLFVTQSDDGVDASGAARGEITRGDADQGQEKRYGEEGGGIGGADAVEKRAQEASKREGSDQAGAYAEEGDACAFADDAAKHVGGLSAESDADSDLTGALGDDVRHHAI